MQRPGRQGLWSLAGDSTSRQPGPMSRPIGFALTVFVTTLVVNVAVVAIWPDRSVEWVSSLVVAATASAVLAVLYRKR